MKCANCQKEIPAGSRFCLNCGAPQPQFVPVPPVSQDNAAADAGPVASSSKGAVPEDTEFNWMVRELQFDANLDYAAQRQYGGVAGKAIGCMGYGFFLIIGLLLLIPGVPILAIAGLPLALLLGPLTYFNVGQLQNKLRSIKFLQLLPGFASKSIRIMALSVSGYLAAVSILCIMLMILTTRH
jgi:hypothetical protein